MRWTQVRPRGLRLRKTKSECPIVEAANTKRLLWATEHYGYPGGFVEEDETVVCVYYDAANEQRRTSVWGIRFRIDDDREALRLLPYVTDRFGSLLLTALRPA